jgi:hypothetical protein
MRDPDPTTTDANAQPSLALPPPAVRRYLRHASFLLLTVASIALLQIHFLSVRVVQGDEWPEAATFLKDDAPWRYGYVHGIHGAILIKAGIPVAVGVKAKADQGTRDPAFTAEMNDYMRRELESLPSLAVYEGLFYFSWALLLRFAMPPLFRRLAGGQPSPRRKATVSAILTLMTVGYLLGPMVVTCYGASAYSTWAGPFAMAWSGPYLPPTLWSGETISYRPVLEVALLPMMFLLGRLGGGWVAPLILSGVYAWIASRAVVAWRARRRVVGMRRGSAPALSGTEE